jgi:CRISPR/Cas system CSM-associated protein Csm3 (group 7 of RAMP superfamily)
VTGGVSGPALPRGRWIVSATLVTRSAVHVGAGEPGETVDSPLARDATGGVLVSGEGVAGALREALCALRLGYGVEESSDPERMTGVVRLLGGRPGDDDGPQSRVLVHHARCPAEAVEVRAGVELTAQRTARPGHLYDAEVVPAGQRFDIRLDLDTDRRGDQGDDDPAELLALLALALEGLEDGTVGLGARATRGWARCSVETVRLWWFPLGDDRASWQRWLRLGLRPGNAPDPADGAAIVPVQGQRSAGAAPVSPLAAGVADGVARLAGDALAEAVREHLDRLRGPRGDRRRSLRVAVEATFASGLLVGGVTGGAEGPDAVHLLSGGKDVLPGTSLAGALRAEAGRVAARIAPSVAGEMVEALFGTASDGNDPRRGSPLVVDEVPLRGGTRVVGTRVRLDPFTGGNWTNGLFDEEVLHGASGLMAVTLRLPWMEASSPALPRWNAVAGLTLRVMVQLARGRVALGGTVGVGRGTVLGTHLWISGVTPDGRELEVDRALDGDGRFTDGQSGQPRPLLEEARRLLEGLVAAIHTAEPEPAAVAREDSDG